VADAPTVRHQQAVGAFYLALAPHVRERRLGTLLLSPLDVVFDYRRALVLQPDVVFISLARQSIVKERVLGAPDLVLEVLSPHPRIGRLQERVEWFAEYGVREIWLLHQDSERFDVLTTADGRVAGRRDLSYLEPIQSSVLPGFRMTVGDILRD
jgi:Uma2 family endonuclease